jgi:hypothetical protein
MAIRVHHQPRAERYTIPVTILYRTAGEPWQSGLTENISRSGVLFRTERHLALDTPLELMLEVPAILDSADPGGSVRRGRVVRAIAPSSRERRPAVAATFIDLHTPTIDPRRI